VLVCTVVVVPCGVDVGALSWCVQWALRALLISMVISWTAIVASHLDSISALGFTGGLCILGLALITLDLFDVLNYSDEVHQS
jgi:hypothetical protein